jgi:pyruvate-formate lyase
MKTLQGHHLEAALAAPHPLAVEHAITAAHRAHVDSSPTEREVAVLAHQLPATLQPIEPGDLFAGRIRYPLVSFGPEPAGLGYACLADDVCEVVRSRALGPEAASAAEAMIGYWRARGTAARVRAAYPPALAAALPSDDWFNESGAGFPLHRMAGTVLDYAKLLRVGLPGLCDECAFRRSPRGLDPHKRNFLWGVEAALGLVADALLRYAAEARRAAEAEGDPVRATELMRIADSCAAVAVRPPRTLHEAIQLAWVYALLSGTWNYGRVDDWLGAFLARDLDEGRLDEEAAIALLAGWWRLMKAYENQYNNRVILGGVGRADPAAADRFARLALEATRRARLNQPQVSLRFHAGQDPALMTLALDLLGEGLTFPILYNDDVNVPAVARALGVSEAEAAGYTPYGCGEYVLASRAVASPNGVVNLLKCLELALHDGRDPVSGRLAGPRTGPLVNFSGFEDLWRAYAAQVEHMVAALAEHQRLAHDVTGREAPFLLLSALHDDCLARGQGIFAGGVRHVGGTIETYGNTNAADALTAIARRVFTEGALSLPELVRLLDGDFAGTDGAAWRERLQAAPKYGNDDDEADAMAVRVHEHVCEAARAQAARVGLDSYLVVVINNWANTVLGRSTAASADGRRAGAPMANANNPAPGADRAGVTAFMRSLLKLDPALHAGSVQNMKFSTELFRRRRPQLEALLATYWAGGGAQAMLTVVSRADLEQARREPAKWGHLMVRVGGFSIRFIDLPPEAQEEVLARTLHE